MQKTHSAENKKSILVVDDDLSICQVYEYFFGSKGFESHIALSAEEALGILDKYNVDIVITNVNMPGMNGFELTSIIKTNTKLDVIIVTGLREGCSYEEASRVGAGALFYKPVNLNDLLNSVSRLLDKRRRNPDK
jgi:DNA-binding NtrC family response regulator